MQGEWELIDKDGNVLKSSKTNPPSVRRIVDHVSDNSPGFLKDIVTFAFSGISAYIMKDAVERGVEKVNSSQILKILGSRSINKRLVSYPLLAAGIYLSRTGDQKNSMTAGACTGIALHEVNQLLESTNG